LNNVTTEWDTARKDRKLGIPCVIKKTTGDVLMYEPDEPQHIFKVFYEGEANKNILKYNNNELITFSTKGAHPNYGDSFSVANLCQQIVDNRTKDITAPVQKVVDGVGRVLLKRSLDYTQVAFVKELNTSNTEILIGGDIDTSTNRVFILVTFDRLCFLKALYENIPVLFEESDSAGSTLYLCNNSQSANRISTEDDVEKALENLKNFYGSLPVINTLPEGYLTIIDKQVSTQVSTFDEKLKQIGAIKNNLRLLNSLYDENLLYLVQDYNLRNAYLKTEYLTSIDKYLI
jgi:hypothetical protein